MRYPVLDDSKRDGMVLGFATTKVGALRVAMRWARQHGIDGVIGVNMQWGVNVTYDPEINTRAEARRAEAAGSGWVVQFDDAA
jgi:hypothetical protein